MQCCREFQSDYSVPFWLLIYYAYPFGWVVVV